MVMTNPQTRTSTNGRTESHTQRRFTETKAFYKTSEFMIWAATVIGILVVTYIDDSASLSNWHGWLLIAIVSAAYLLSRGIAKSGTREPYTPDQDR